MIAESEREKNEAEAAAAMSERRIKMQEVIISEYQRKAADESVTRMTSGRHSNITSATAAQLLKDIVKISSDDWMSIGDDELKC